MANLKLTASSAVQKWSKDFFQEYVRESGLKSLMGTDDSAVIKLFPDLKAGNSCLVHVPHIARLRAAGVTGATALMGNEEALANYSYAVKATVSRHAVNVLVSEQIQTEMDLLAAAKGGLKLWSSDKLRTDLLNCLQTATVAGSANADGTPGEDSQVSINTASATALNNWITTNADRVLFGAAKNNNTGTFSTSIANVDVAADRPTASTVLLLKRMARQAGVTSGHNHIRPVRIEDGREYFYYLVGSNGFRDIANDSAMQQANRDARPRDVNENPIFQDGDMIYNGVIIREIPELADLTATGAAGVALNTGFLVGAGAISMGYAQMDKPISQEYDYGFQQGVGVQFVRGQGKTSFNGVDYGVITHIHASQADS